MDNKFRGMKIVWLSLLIDAAIITVVIVLTSLNSLTPILMYHSVDNENRFGTPTVSPENFKKQMEFLKKNGFKVISLKEFVEAVRQDKGLPYKCVVITFDDGYADNFLAAYPVLVRAGFPAIIFVSSDFMGKENYFSADDANQMIANGISIGAHGRTHEYLPSLPTRKLEYEIKGARQQLESKLGSRVDFFCYPIGGYDSSIVDAVKSAGYLGACTTNRSGSILNRDLYALNRIKMTNKDTDDLQLWGKTSRLYNLARGVSNFFKKHFK